MRKSILAVIVLIIASSQVVCADTVVHRCDVEEYGSTNNWGQESTVRYRVNNTSHGHASVSILGTENGVQITAQLANKSYISTNSPPRVATLG